MSSRTSRTVEILTHCVPRYPPFGAPDILIHAACVNKRQPADEVTQESREQTLALNLSAPFFLIQDLVPAMKEKGWGRIVNFASLQTGPLHS